MHNRRHFLSTGVWGLSAAGLGVLGLRADALPTEESGSAGQSPVPFAIPAPPSPSELSLTESNILGPYHRTGAPFRGKVTPPLEPGETLVVRGRVWGFDTRRPLSGAVLDVWQANAAGRYDNDDQNAPPKPGVFINRARLVSDETGYYEFETIKPGRYQIGDNLWRPAHIHYRVTATGYKPLVTQLYFDGDPYNGKDQFIKPSLIISPEKIALREGSFLLGTFDIVLAK